jgi:glutamine amidotransferase
MKNLESLQLIDAIKEVASKGVPIMGICLGMQLLANQSEEGVLPGLGLIKGRVLRFGKNNDLKVPHMGWNQVYQKRSHPMWQNIADAERFYYVHSYYVEPQQTSIIAGSSNYPVSFTSVIAKDNIFAVQFHPEKSQHAGLAFLKNFVAWDGTI